MMSNIYASLCGWAIIPDFYFTYAELYNYRKKKHQEHMRQKFPIYIVKGNITF